MFFRLPKNTIKNLHFGPFEGGYPPSPPPPLNTASAYAFIIKIINFHKKPLITFIFLFFFLLWAGDCRRQSPPKLGYAWGVRTLADWGGEMVNLILLDLSFLLFDFESNNSYSIASVRTRNTLHVVGAPSL